MKIFKLFKILSGIILFILVVVSMLFAVLIILEDTNLLDAKFLDLIYDKAKEDYVLNAFSLIATSALGVISLYISLTLAKMESKRENCEKSCVVSIESVCGKYDFYTTFSLNNECETKYPSNEKVSFIVENNGVAMLQKIMIKFDKENFCSHLSILPGSKKMVYVPIPINFDKDRKIKVTFVSCYAKETYGTFDLNELDKECSFDCNNNCENCNYTIKYYHYNAFDKKGQ